MRVRCRGDQRVLTHFAPDESRAHSTCPRNASPPARPSRAHRRRGVRLRAIAGTLTFLATLISADLVRADVPAITPREPIVLFNGKDLSNFYTWIGQQGREDPDRVFTVVDQIDGASAIRSSGQHFGGLVTKSSYTNYRLITEFRWGAVTWEPRKTKARDSGILLHLQGEDGNHAKNFRGAWSRSVEYQILEGGTGDIWLVDGYDRDRPEPISPRLMIAVKPDTRVWDPAGTPTEFKLGRIAWRQIDPEWKPVLGFRGRNDVEKPLGQWNLIEAVCDGGDVTYFLNGVKVNEGKNGSFKEGRILFQSEGAEVFFRRIELHPLKK